MIQIILFAVFLLGTSIGWSADEASNIQSLIKSYDQARPNSKESFLAGSALIIKNILQNHKNPSMALSPSEQASLKRAEKELEGLNIALKELESKLTPEDIQTITKENPNSIYRLLGKFHFTGHQEDCTPQKYDSLLQQMDVAELYNRGRYVGALISAREIPFQTGYRKALSDLVRKDARFKNYRFLDETLLNHELADQVEKDSRRSAISSDISSSSGSTQKTYEDRLVKSGLARNEVNGYANKLALMSPECLAFINVHLLQRIKKDLTAKKIERFSERLKGAKLDKTILYKELKRFTIKSDAYLNEVNDGWGRHIEIEEVGPNKIELVSLGNDRKKSTDDLRSKPIDVQF